jgi:benzil reductase ((S)-benzoin forming)
MFHQKYNEMNVFITGTSSGIGYALTIEFLEHGATVYGISRTHHQKLREYDGYHHLSHDLLKLNELPGKLDSFLAGVKTIDLVILNAGILLNVNNMRKTPVDEITTMMRVNVWANKVIIDTLLEKVSSIYQVVAISCGSDISETPGFDAYSLSKVALNQMIKYYSREIPEIHFSALAPGMIDTNLQERISRIPNSNGYSIAKKLKKLRKNGQLTDPYLAANYLVEAMGTVLQEESGSYKDVRDILLLDPDNEPRHWNMSPPNA